VGEVEPLNPPGIKFIARAGVWGYIVLSIILCAVFFLLGVIVFAFLTKKPRRRLAAMKESDVSEMEFQLMKLFNKYADLFEYHQWPLEHLRWVELIFALVSRISDKPGSELRDIIEELDYLELLDMGELSQIPESKDGIDLDFPRARRIVEFLSEAGLTEEESRSSVLVMHEAANNLKRLYEGKIQEYIRKYGRQMMDELSQHFPFSKMNEADIKYAFTYWLQNVLNMPISLEDENIERFCRKFGKEPEELLEAADKLDINLALLDDAIEQYMEDEANPAEEEQSGSGNAT
jgi:hypothetical protein